MEKFVRNFRFLKKNYNFIKILANFWSENILEVRKLCQCEKYITEERYPWAEIKLRNIKNTK